MKYLLAIAVLAGLGTFGHAARADEASKARRVERVFARLDADKDGKISRDEAKNGPRVDAHFDEIDADKDGFITPADCLAFFHRHHRK